MPSSLPARRHETHRPPPNPSASASPCRAPLASSPPKSSRPTGAENSVPPPPSSPTFLLREIPLSASLSTLLLCVIFFFLSPRSSANPALVAPPCSRDRFPDRGV